MAEKNDVTSPMLGRALDRLDLLRRAAKWSEFAIIERCNVFRHLLRRGWVADDGSFRPYQDGEEYTGPRCPLYVLTDAGREALRRWREMSEQETQRLRKRVEWWKDHCEALDCNWSAVHEAAMVALRTALGLPDGTVPELVARIEAMRRVGTLLQDVLDFIGVEGVVDERYAHRRDQLCASLRASLRELDRLA